MVHRMLPDVVFAVAALFQWGLTPRLIRGDRAPYAPLTTWSVTTAAACWCSRRGAAPSSSVKVPVHNRYSTHFGWLCHGHAGRQAAVLIMLAAVHAAVECWVPVLSVLSLAGCRWRHASGRARQCCHHWSSLPCHQNLSIGMQWQLALCWLDS